MAGNIKGITIEFAGDTTKLDRSIRDAEKNSRKLDQELRKVNKAIKFNPQSVELWSQKQQILGERIEETKNKLEALKQKQTKMDAAGIDKTSAEYRNLEREIVETDSKLQHFQKELKEVGNAKITALGNQFEQIGSKISSVGDSMTKKLTLPLAAIGAGSFAAFNEVDKGMDAVVTKTGATGEQLEEMQTIVKDLATEIPAGFEDIGNAVGEVNTRFGVTGQDLDDLTAQFLKFAQVNGTDVTSSIDGTQKVMAAFGLSTEDAGKLLDTFTAVGQRTGLSMETLTGLLIKGGPQLQEMGLDAYQAANFLGDMEKSGIDVTQSVTAMQKALKYATAQGKPLQEVLTDFDRLMKSNASETEKLNAAYEIFGTKTGAAMYQAAKNGTVAFDELGKSVDDNLGILDQTFENTLDAPDQLKMTFNALKEAGAEVGAALGQVLVPMLKKAADGLKKFANWYKQLSPRTKDLITKIGLLAAAAGPLLSIVGRMTTGIGGIIKKVPTLISGVKGLVTALATNPYLAIAAGAAAAAAGIAALVLSQNKITREYENAKKAREEEIQGVYTQAATAEIYAQKLDELSQKENKSATDKQLIKTYVDQLNGSVEGLNLTYDAENDKLSQSTEQIYSKIEAYKQQVIQQAYANQMQQVANDLVETEMALDDVRMQKKQANADLEKAIAAGNIDQQNYLMTKIKELDTTEGQLQAKQKGLMSELDRYGDKAAGKIEKVGDTMGSVAAEAGSQGSNTGANWAAGFTSGMGSVIDRIKQQAVNLVMQATNAAKAAAGIHSPSTLTRDVIGKNLGLGVAEGLSDSLGTVEKEARGFIDGTVNAMMATPPQLQVAGIGTAGSRNAIAGTPGNTYTINVIGTPGMDVNQLATAVQNKIIQTTKRRADAWA